MSNTDKVVKYVLDNTKDLSASKIKALAEVVKALGGELKEEPNKVDAIDDPNLMDEEQPLDLSEVTGMVIDGKKQPIKIYNN